MKRKVNKILEELYEYDSSLKKEKDLWKVVENMLLFKPNLKIDDRFKSDLKSKLHNEISKNVYKNLENKKEKIPFLFILKYIFSWVFITSIGIFSLVNLWFFDSVLNPNEKQIIQIPEWVKTNLIDTEEQIENNELIKNENFTDTKIEEKKQIAVKNIAPKIWENKKIVEKLPENKENIDENETKKSELETNSNEYEFPKEAYDLLFLPELPTNDSDIAWNISDSMVNSKMMQPSLMMDYWENFWNHDAKIVFIEKVKKLNITNYDLSNISESSTWVLHVTENKEYWMIFSIDFDNLLINISKNDSNWPKNKSNTWSLLSNSEIFTISNDFIKNYNIDLNNPEIQEKNEKIATIRYLSEDWITSVILVIDLSEKRVISLKWY